MMIEGLFKVNRDFVCFERDFVCIQRDFVCFRVAQTLFAENLFVFRDGNGCWNYLSLV